MKRYNPLQLKEGGQLLTFPNIQEFYSYFLEQIYTDFAAGFIDYYVFLYDHAEMRGADLHKICMKVQEGWKDSQFFSLRIDWNQDTDTILRLSALLTKLSRVMSNYEFDEYQFNIAYELFRNEKER